MDYPSLKGVVVYKEDPYLPPPPPPPMEENGQLIIPHTERTLNEDFIEALGVAIEPFIGDHVPSDAIVASMINALRNVVLNYQRVKEQWNS